MKSQIDEIADQCQVLLQKLTVKITNHYIVNHDDLDDDSLVEISCVFGGTLANMVAAEVQRRKEE
jgi:hypothetical protein